jgi:ABC-type amino acid transport substrate-binding protein
MGHRAAATATVWLALISLAIAASAADLAEMQVRGTLRVLVSADEQREAFSLKGDGPPGFDRELIEGFARLHDLRLEAVPVERFADMIPKLKGGEGDLITGIIDTPARREEIDFTAEVLPARLVIVSRSPHAAPASVEALKTETVGVIPGNAWARAVAEAGVPASRQVEFANVGALLDGLREDRITATVMSVVDYTLSRRHDPELRAGGFLGPQGSGAWGVRKDDPRLLEALNTYLGDTRRSGSWNRLVVKYYGEAALEVLGRSRE